MSRSGGTFPLKQFKSGSGAPCPAEAGLPPKGGLILRYLSEIQLNVEN